jgi:hypothetical protein
MTIPQHPFRSQWQPIEINMMGYRIVDTIEGAPIRSNLSFLQSASERSCRKAHQVIFNDKSR